MSDIDLPHSRDISNKDLSSLSGSRDLREIARAEDKKIITDPDEIAEHLANHELEQKEAAKSAVADMEMRIRLLKKRFSLDDPKEQKAQKDWSAIPISSDERKRLRDCVIDLSDKLKSDVKGQDHAVDKVVQALMRAAAGVDPEDGPIGSFLELGRTGGGKTYLIERLAHHLSNQPHGLPFQFMKIDCSEYSNGHEGTRLTGAPPSYIGSDKKNEFDKIVEHPYWVVLFDEFEKGSEKLHDLLLQILDKARATTAQGKPVSFRRCIVVMTSNVGVNQLDTAVEKEIGFSRSAETQRSLSAQEVEEVTAAALRGKFKPELLNRIDEIVAFRDLTPEVIASIADNELSKLAKHVEKTNRCRVRVTTEALDLISEKGYSPEFQARELKRTIKRLVSTPLAEKIITLGLDEVKKSVLVIDAVDGKIKISHEPRMLALSAGSTPQEKAA